METRKVQNSLNFANKAVIDVAFWMKLPLLSIKFLNIKITSQLGLPLFSLLLSYISSSIRRRGDQSIKSDICDNRDFPCISRL